MASPSTITATFGMTVSCNSAISWSKDYRIALCTDKAVCVVEMLFKSFKTDPSFQFVKSLIEAEEPHVLIEGFNYMGAHKRFKTEDLHHIMLDRTLCPAAKSTTSHAGFQSAEWSPLGADEVGRSVLATLTHDHRLSIYSTGRSLRTWRKVVELSEIYRMSREVTNSLIPNNKDLKRHRQECYARAAVVVGWSPDILTEEDGKLGSPRFTLLAAGMKNGDIVLWKICLPCLDDKDVKVVKVINPEGSIPTAISWADPSGQSTSGMFAVGYLSGVVQAVDVTYEKGELEMADFHLHESHDLLAVSVLAWTTLPSGCRLLLVCKEHHVMAYAIYAVLSKSLVMTHAHCMAAHYLHGTGIACHGDTIIMSSADGLLQKIEIVEEQQTIKMGTQVITIDKDTAHTWTCHGVALSVNAMYCAAVYSPSSDYDHLKMRDPLKLHIVPVMPYTRKHLNDMLTASPSLLGVGDILECLRQCLGREGDLSAVIEDYRSWYAPRLADQPLPVLKTLRYAFQFFCTLSLALPETEGLALDPKQLQTDEQLQTMLITLHHVATSVELLNKNPPKNLTDFEQQILVRWHTWATQEMDGGILGEEGEDLRLMIATSIERIVPGEWAEGTAPTCLVCKLPFSQPGSLMEGFECERGHKFGTCCWTLLPCQVVPFRQCAICDALSYSIEQLHTIAWLAGDKNRCKLCDGLLL